LLKSSQNLKALFLCGFVPSSNKLAKYVVCSTPTRTNRKSTGAAQKAKAHAETQSYRKVFSFAFFAQI
jgi:hypothetical protein